VAGDDIAPRKNSTVVISSRIAYRYADTGSTIARITRIPCHDNSPAAFGFVVLFARVIAGNKTVDKLVGITPAIRRSRQA
jgi:hypothetical protein